MRKIVHVHLQSRINLFFKRERGNLNRRNKNRSNKVDIENFIYFFFIYVIKDDGDQFISLKSIQESFILK